jgi:WD40 repeat protein
LDARDGGTTIALVSAVPKQKPKRSAVGEAFHAAFGDPQPAAPNGLFFKSSMERSLWQSIQPEIGSGWYLDRFLYLFGDDLGHLEDCLDAWAFLVPEGKDRKILGRNAYGSILVLENANEIDQKVFVLDPFRVVYWTHSQIVFGNLLGAYLPERLIPGFLDTALYDAWTEVNGPLSDRTILGTKVPMGLGGALDPENVQEEDIVEYYRTTAPIYEKAWRKMGREPAREVTKASPRKVEAEAAPTLRELRGPSAPPLAPVGKKSVHAEEIHAAAVLPDGKQVVSSAEDGKLIVSGPDGKKLQTLSGHKGPVNTLCLTPDGRRLVTGGDDHMVLVWDTRTWKVTTRLRGHSDFVRAVAASDAHVVSGSDDHTVRIWDLASGRCLHQAEHAASVDEVAISHDGRSAASSGRDNSLWCWDVATGEKRVVYEAGAQVIELGDSLYHTTKNHTGKGHVDAPMALAFLRSGELLSVAAEAIFWDPATLTEKRRFAIGTAWSASLDPEERYLVTVDGGFQLWELASGNRVAAIMVGSAQCATFTPDRSLLVVGDSGGQLTRWNVAAALEAPAADHDGRIDSLRISGNRAVSGSSDGALWLWNLDEGKAVVRLAAAQSQDRACALSPSGARVLVGGKDNAIDVWELADARQVGRLSCGTKAPHGLAFVGEDRMLVGHLDDGLVEHTGAGEPKPFDGYTNQVSEILVRGDGRLAVTNGFFQPGAETRGGKESGSRSSELMLQGWDLAKRRLLWTVTQKKSSSFVLFTKGGDVVIQSPTKKSVVTVLDGKTGVPVRELKVPFEWTSAARMLDGDVLLCTEGRTLVRFEGDAAKPLDQCDLEIDEHPDSVAFSPDGRIAALASYTGLRLCGTRDGRLHAFAPTTVSLTKCAFSDDGTRVIAGDDAGRVYVFAVN